MRKEFFGVVAEDCLREPKANEFRRPEKLFPKWLVGDGFLLQGCQSPSDVVGIKTVVSA
jgi:hypothetical protein